MRNNLLAAHGDIDMLQNAPKTNFQRTTAIAVTAAVAAQSPASAPAATAYDSLAKPGRGDVWWKLSGHLR